jgi:hypothetical protein
MTTIAEIEAAIEKLPHAQVDQLARWLEALRQTRTTPAPVENWLKHARGAAISGAMTDEVMAKTRGEE